MEDRLRLDISSSRRITAVDLVRDALRAAILRGDLPGGSRLVQCTATRGEIVGTFGSAAKNDAEMARLSERTVTDDALG